MTRNPNASGPKRVIVVSGMIAGDPNQGGATWAILQYVLGLRRLGHEVLLVEPVRGESIVPAVAAYFWDVAARFGLARSAALLRAGSRETVGLPYDELRRICSRADALLNVSGMLADDELIARIPTRVYLDLDPAFIQCWQAQGIDMRFSAHSHFVTVGLALGSPDCPVPTCGRDWITTVQPIVLEHWPVAERIEQEAFTTVGNWRGYGSVEHQGVFYGQKAHSLRQFITLPGRVRANFVLAYSIHPGEAKDLEALAANGWEIVDPRRVAGTPDDYRQFIQGSKAEIGIAKSGYAASRCGWFSDRSLCYLASGRPVLAQETGFSRFLPTGAGLLAFDTTDGAAAAVEQINRDYRWHCRAARDIAEEYFDSDLVLTRLLELTGVL
jgi:hypothetical protein